MPYNIQPLAVKTSIHHFCVQFFISGYYERWGRDLSFLEVWRQMADYYQSCGLLNQIAVQRVSGSCFGIPVPPYITTRSAGE